MSAAPPWRRRAPTSAGARLAALGALGIGLLFLAVFVARPLVERVDAARERAARLDLRAGALIAAAQARKAEAGLAETDQAALAAATEWLARNAPIQDEGAATLDLLSSLRLLADAAGVELSSAAPLDAGRADGGFFAGDAPAAPHVAAAEARIAADHAGLARFLMAIEAARPPLRAAALDITARSAAPVDEDARLTVSVIVGALSRPRAGD